MSSEQQSSWLWHRWHKVIVACGVVSIGLGNGLLLDGTKPSAIPCVKHTWLPTCLN